MVKHFSFAIGCIILYLSAALIIPTNCSPIEENGQKEINFTESRSKRQTQSQSQSQSKASSYAEAESVADTIIAQSSPRSALFQLLGQSNPSMGPVVGKMMNPMMGNMMPPGNSFDGLEGILNGLGFGLTGIVKPLFGTLGGTVGSVGDTLENVVGGLGRGLPPIDGLTNLVNYLLEALFGSGKPIYRGGGGGGVGTPAMPGMSKPTPDLSSLYGFIAKLPKEKIIEKITKTESKSTSTSSSSASSSSSSGPTSALSSSTASAKGTG